MNTHIKFSIILILMVSACRKERINHDSPANPDHNVSLTLADAKQFISQTNPDSSTALSEINVDWELARTTTIQNGNKFTIPLSGQPIFQGYKQGYRELVILRNKKSQKPEAKILEIIPDAIYLQKQRKASNSDFTGRVFEYDLNYNLTGGRLYSEGKAVGKIRQFPKTQQTGPLNQGLKDLNPFNGAQGKVMKLMAVETCAWTQESYIDAQGDLTVHSTQVCSTTYFSDGGDGYYDGVGANDPGASPGDGGGGNSGTSSAPAPSNLPGEEKNAVNPKEMMECFSNIPSANAAFVIRVYVVEPQPGTAFNVGANSFGHVAISLSKTSGNTTITQTVGFYPTGTGLDKLSSTSQIIDNGDMEYNMNATYYVTADSFKKVVDFVSNPTKNYHFTDYNCSAFVYGAGQAGGLPIPDPTGVIGMGFGKTPAGMANALREQKAKNPNLDINEGGGRVPGSKGPCKIK